MVEITLARKTAAYKIHMDIMAAGEVAAESFSTFCRLLKQMRDDKLYEALEYSSFEVYCENAVGIKQSQAYNYIKAIEDFGEEKFQSIGKLGIRKLQLLGTVPADQREEFTQQNNIEEMTTRQVEASVKDYKDKLIKKDAELLQKQQALEKANKYADEHMMRARQAEKEVTDKEKSIQSLRLNESMKEKEIINLRQQLDQAKRNGDPAKVKELGQKISGYQDEIESYQIRISNMNIQLADIRKQLKEKPIEVPATKAVIPDDVKNAIYNKVAALYQGILNLTETEIQIFAEGVSPDDSDEVVNSLGRASTTLSRIIEDVLDPIDENAFPSGILKIDPTGRCGACKYADMDKVSQEQLDEDKTWCTLEDVVVDFDHKCGRFERLGGRP
jgi:hypothetical protein